MQGTGDGMDIMKWIWDEESGQGMVEYVLILILVSVAATYFVKEIGGTTSGYFGQAADKF